jgi:DNA-binding SARP family transcriptional activator/tetratricopeptide (TPR) repeat protein
MTTTTHSDNRRRYGLHAIPDSRPILRIRLFGQLELEWDDTPLAPPRSPGARFLLAFLVTQAGRSFSRDPLAGTFWSDRPDLRARRALSQALWQIRRALGPAAADRLVAGREAVTFHLLPDDWLDVEEFQATVHKYTGTQKARTLPIPLSTCLLELSEAVTLYRADFLQECYDDWALLERERLWELYLDALQTLIAAHKRRGEYEEALANAQKLVAADPLRESAHQELMRLYHLLGRDRAALEQYETLCQVLADEMGAEPMATTVALAQEIAIRLEEVKAAYLPVEVRPAPVFEQPELLPLVGREEERATLLTHLEAAIGGQGGLVLVEGEAGVGKTRLVQEIARDAEWRGAQACWGRGRELAELPPYGVLREALHGTLSPLRASQLAELVEGIWLREVSRVQPELAEWLPDLPPQVDLGPEQQRARLLEALTRTVLALGHIVPHLLIMDDLQWVDEATLSALAHLTRQLTESRVLVIGSYRGAEAREQPAVWEALQALDRGGGHQRLLLARLTAEGTAELVRRGLGLAAGAPLFEERLYQETEGNPLFVLETLRALQDEGLLYRDEDGDWSTPWDEATADYAELPLPAGVCQVINRRLARLEANERAALDVAAVLGRDFGFALLARAGHLEREVALAVVSELLRRRFLVEEPAVYRFSHDKVRQVAYLGIEEAQRQRLHQQAGRALEVQHPEQVEQLAHHFSLGQVWDKALAYNRQAGERARAVYAGAEAVGYYDRALEAWEHLRPASESLGLSLYQERGRICLDTGRFDQAEADLQAAYDLAEQVGDRAGQSRVLNFMSYLQYQRGDFSGAAAVAQQALDLATAAGLPSEIATGLFNKANAARNPGHYQAAIGFYERAVAMYEELGSGHRARLADCLNRLGAALLLSGAYARARSFVERALTIRRQLDDRMGIAYSLSNLGLIYYHQGQFALSRKATQEALEIASAIGDTHGEGVLLSNLGIMTLELGFPTQAIPFFRRCVRIAREIGARSMESGALCGLGRVYHHFGDLEQAQEVLEQSLSMASVTERRFVPQIHTCLAQSFLTAGRNDEALAHARAGLQEAQEMEDPWTLGLTQRVMGQVAAHIGSEKAGTEPGPHFEESIRLLREIGAEAELARSLAAYGLYLGPSADAAQARRSATLLDEARTSFQQLGMAGDLARLQAEAATCLLPGQIRRRLPRAEAPTGRPLRGDEWVEVTWTVAAPEDDEVPGKVARRHHQLLRLLREAAAQGAAPTVPDLTAALGVGTRTIERDLAALRTAGHAVRTRGARL